MGAATAAPMPDTLSQSPKHRAPATGRSNAPTSWAETLDETQIDPIKAISHSPQGDGAPVSPD